MYTATNEVVPVRATEGNESTTSQSTSLQFDEDEPAESTSQSSGHAMDKTSSSMKDSSSETVEEDRQSELPQGRADKGNIIMGKWGSVSWSFSKDTGVLTFTSGGTLKTWDYSPWWDSNYDVQSGEIKKIIFQQPVYATSNSQQLFSDPEDGLYNLEEIVGLDKIDTSCVWDMTSMFRHAIKLKGSVDLSSWNPRYLSYTKSMFDGCSSIENINLSNWKTVFINNTSYMFRDARSLKNLNLSGWDTKAENNPDHMAHMTDMFKGTTNLSTLTIGPRFSFRNRDGKSETNLPSIRETDRYTGRWQGPNMSYGSSVDLMNAYTGNYPGTYVWETKPAKIELQKVPENFSFSSTLQQETYTISQTGLAFQTINVWCNLPEQEWSVKAAVENNQVTIKNTADRLDVSQFKLNNIPLVGTGNTGIVVKSATETPVTSVEISFSDPKHQLKANTQLDTNIRYQLYNTETAE